MWREKQEVCRLSSAGRHVCRSHSLGTNAPALPHSSHFRPEASKRQIFVFILSWKTLKPGRCCWDMSVYSQQEKNIHRLFCLKMEGGGVKGDSGFLVILFLAFFFNRKLIQRTCSSSFLSKVPNTKVTTDEG